MEINRDNFEAFLLDMAEGNLDDKEIRKVRAFLLEYPGSDPGSVGLEAWTLEGEEIIFPGKERLKKEFPGPESQLEEFRFDLFSIARLEGDLSPGQVEEHERMVGEDRAKLQEWMTWKQTKLQVNEIPFAGRQKLKKREKRASRLIWISTFSAAAATALLLTLFRVIPSGDQTGGMASGPPERVSAPPSVTEESTNKVVQRNLTDGPESVQAEATPVIPLREPAINHPEIYAAPPEVIANRNTYPTTDTRPGDFSFGKREEPLEIPGEWTPEREIFRPGRMAMLQDRPLKSPDPVFRDRIERFDVQLLPHSPADLTWSRISAVGLKQAYREYIREKDLSLLTVASAGINGINRLTESDISLDLSRDSKGEVSGFRLSSNFISVSAPVEKTE